MGTTESRLLDSTIDQVRAGWAARLEVDLTCLETPGLTLVARESSHGLTAIRFFDSTVAICQPELLSTLSPLSSLDFLNMSLLLKSLDDYNVDPIGIASISYADSETLKKSSSFANSREGDLQEVELILSACAESEREESGVATMPFIFIAESITGKPAAVASYEIWSDKIAQLGVLTKPEYRKLGLAASAVQKSIQSALGSALVPQWRCRIGNSSSERLSRTLGFHNVGFQLAIDVLPS